MFSFPSPAICVRCDPLSLLWTIASQHLSCCTNHYNLTFFLTRTPACDLALLNMAPPKIHSKAVDKLDKYRISDGQAPTSSRAIQLDFPHSNAETDSSEQPDSNPDTQKVLAAIHACQALLTTRIEEIKVDISLLRQDAQRTREWVMENRVSTLEDQAPPLTR